MEEKVKKIAVRDLAGKTRVLDLSGDGAAQAQARVEEHNASTTAHADIRQEAQEAAAIANGAAQAAQEAATAAQNAQTAADAALEIITEVANTIGAVPTQSGSLTYTGAAQSPAWNSYDETALTIGGVISGTDAGTYTATFTPKSGRKWADGTTEAKPVTWTISRAPVSAVPSQSGSLTYTGAAQSPAWSNYDSAKLTIGGATSATNAGTYSATFTPGANYRWSDGTTAAKSVSWVIGKAAGSLSLDKTSMSLNNAVKTGTITVTRAGNGAVSATSSNTNVATVSVSGNVVTVTGKAYGNAVITIRVAAGSNHAAPANKTCGVAVKLFGGSLNSNSWAMIREASDAGVAASVWAVGDTKSIVINGKIGETTFSNLAIDVFIIGIDHNASWEGTKRIHFQIGKIAGNLIGLIDDFYAVSNTEKKTFRMNGHSETDGWKGCFMRNTLLGNSKTPTNPLAGSFMAALPSDLRAVMKSATKYTLNTGVTASTDYLFLLSEFEYRGKRMIADEREQSYQLQYPYYRAGNTLQHKKSYKNSDGSYTGAYEGAVVWTRSRRYDQTNGFSTLTGDHDGGNGGSDYCYRSYAIAPGFCV